ncbi:MAG: 16S rRNA (cytosine(967)-C(5))-methyltransferase RsmB [Methylococcales bacterium]
MNIRAIAAEVLCRVLADGRSLTTALEPAKSKLPAGRDRALLQSLCYGALRWYFRLDLILKYLLGKPIKKKDFDIYVLALLGLYQIAYTRVKPYAAVAETVAAASHKKWAKALLNAVLRNYLRQREDLDKMADRDASGRTAHPDWLLRELHRSWGEFADAICAENNSLPPMVLRVNRTRCTQEDYIRMLKAADLDAFPIEFNPDGVHLAKAVDVEKLPGFYEGLVSVQDGAAQFAARILGAQAGHRVLDACAAPGGKTAHILELTPGLAEMVAIDVHPERAADISRNLDRLGLKATVLAGDLLDRSAWWDGRLFDRILLDVPCSATGVIRRHPDIKVLRRPEDIPVLADRQEKMLEAGWSMLAPAGLLVYSTCSVLRQENHEQIERFMKSHDNVLERPIEANRGIRCPVGRQILPGESGMDGFYYACLSRGR